MKKGLIGDISRYCTHDGPGIRTTVFFKGCPLRCPWCHNPEFLSPKPEIAFTPERCIDCGDCLDVCPERAVISDKTVRIDRSLCKACGLCEKQCPSKAIELVGNLYDIDELVEIVLRDQHYYNSSGGGVTLSGGEATAQLDFIGTFLQRLKNEGVHTAIETSGFFSWDEFALRCLNFLDLILFDVKIANPLQHQQIIGVDNEMILANLSVLLKLRPEDVIVRIPLVPGYTATEENICDLVELFHRIKVRRYSLLPYHPYGISKAVKVGRTPHDSLPQNKINRFELQRWQHYFTSFQFVK